jgi:ribonuclease R
MAKKNSTEQNKGELQATILALLNEHAPAMIRLNEIAKALGIRSDSREYDHLRIVLNDMEQRRQIYKSTRRRYGLRPVTELSGFQGIVRFEYNRGAVETESPDFPVIYIRPQNVLTALDGDTVRAKLLALKKDKKPYGVITEIIQRSGMPISGTVEYDGDFYFLIPDEDKYAMDFLIPQRKLGQARGGDKVVCNLLRWDDPHKNPEVEVVEILGRSGDPAVEFAGILKEFNLPLNFPPEVEQEAEALAKPPGRTEIQRRLDLREELIITIDPDDARDFDDALSLEHLADGNLKLGVHIADVTAYVKEGSALDKEAFRRATSTYLVDRVVPMLPESLSNIICSLQPDKTRLAYSVFITLTPRGAVKDYHICETVIRSKKRFTYGEVQKIIEGGKGPHAELVLQLHELACTLREKRYKKGGVDFVTQETRFRLDEQKFPIAAELKGRTDATSLVEECMLLANQTVAQALKKISRQHLRRGLLPFIYRVHDEPDELKLKDVLGFVRALGIQVPSGKPSSLELNHILSQADHLPEKMVINQFILRSMAKAVYADENTGHYGLGFTDYTHFTSPIRRYPDVLVHRLLKEYHSQERPADQRIRMLHEYMPEAAHHCSVQERLAVEAERASQRLAGAQLAKRHMGGVFSGTVTGVTGFGLFVLLDTLNIEGLLHIRDLNGDYYYFEEHQFRLVGKRSRQVFRIGSQLKVQIANANIDKRQVDLRMAPDEQSEDRVEEQNPASISQQPARPKSITAKSATTTSSARAKNKQTKAKNNSSKSKRKG